MAAPLTLTFRLALHGGRQGQGGRSRNFWDVGLVGPGNGSACPSGPVRRDDSAGRVDVDRELVRRAGSRDRADRRGHAAPPDGLVCWRVRRSTVLPGVWPKILT